MSPSADSNLNTPLEAPTTPPPTAAFAQLRSFAAGGVGGVCAVITGHPFDLIKVRLQTAEKGVYSGAIDCVRKTIAREGPVRVCISSFAVRLKGHLILSLIGFIRWCICATVRSHPDVSVILSPCHSSQDYPLTTSLR